MEERIRVEEGLERLIVTGLLCVDGRAGMRVLSWNASN